MEMGTKIPFLINSRRMIMLNSLARLNKKYANLMTLERAFIFLPLQFNWQLRKPSKGENNETEAGIDPQGRPTVMVSFSHEVSVVRTFVHTFQNLAKQNKFQVSEKSDRYWRSYVGLAEWIIDDAHFLFLFFSC